MAPGYRLLRLPAVGRGGWRAKTWACAPPPRRPQALGRFGGSARPPWVPSAADERYLRHRSSASARRNVPRRVAPAEAGIATCPDSSLRRIRAALGLGGRAAPSPGRTGGLCTSP